MMTEDKSKEVILANFMEATKMNQAYALQALEHNDWSYNSAYAVFLQLKQDNRLPAEAFS